MRLTYAIGVELAKAHARQQMPRIVSSITVYETAPTGFLNLDAVNERNRSACAVFCTGGANAGDR
jgi:hypothetical protein